MERLQKAIAQSGFCSRRKAEEYIIQGKVKVNGKVVDILGSKVKPNDTITINGQALVREDKVYYVMNKPKGCVCTSKDEHNRKTVLDYIHIDQRVYPVGRLDYDTSGVLLLTNDGDFTNKMIHPRYHLPKTYIVNLQGILSEDDIRKLRKGLSDGKETFLPAKVYMLETDPTRDGCRFELTITEGKNHQVKNMMAILGHEVRRLHRKRFGFIEADTLKPGEIRQLKPYEVKKLLYLANQGETK